MLKANTSAEHQRKLGKKNEYLKRLRSFPRIDSRKYQHTAVSLFSGGGGLDLGMALAGFDVRFASDIEVAHCDTIVHNFPDCITLNADVFELKATQIRRLTGLKNFDVVIGGPPCQAFSILGQRNSFRDPRGRLVYEYVRLVKEIKPKAFLFENVPGFMSLNKGKDWLDLLEYIRGETGYRLFSGTLNAADYGVPQIRQRVIIVGFRSRTRDFVFPPPTHRYSTDQPTLLNNLISGNKCRE